MGSVVAGAGVNPADQRWGFWPLQPIDGAWSIPQIFVGWSS